MVDDKIQRMENIVSQLSNLNLDAALKTNLGEVSLGPTLTPRITKMIEQVQVAAKYIDDVNRLEVIPLADQVQGFAQGIGQLTGTEPGVFIQQRSNYSNDLSNRLDQIDITLLPFKLAENRRRIDNVLGGETANVEKIRESLKVEAETILASVKAEAESVLKEALQQATAIQNTARSTAAGVTVIQTQVHFADLIATFKRGATVSGFVAGAAFILFVAYVTWLLNQTPDLRSIPGAIYASAIRVTLLASMAAVVTFALKIFRANLHMYYHTLHRQQLTNSIQSFVDAARTDEHRDAVLTRLVDAVSTFGSSGLIGSSDDMPNTAKIIVDAIPKVLGKSDH
jgi:hypothetical protein